ncbi:hypothetical protein V8G54_021251 [Vigna mungo]|uniref:Uncharacterized protein n=1 Tax=Vigna mungo TaxID=3915 RepID=A0AAQ3ND11_VIGMU
MRSTTKLVQHSNHSYLWTSRSPLLFVICHVKPLLGSKPGCEISKPCFLTSFKYLHKKQERHLKLGLKIKQKLKKKGTSHIQYSLFCIEVLNTQVFIPYEYIVIRCNNVRMQKPLGIPPKREKLKLSIR